MVGKLSQAVKAKEGLDGRQEVYLRCGYWSSQNHDALEDHIPGPECVLHP